MQVKWQDAGNGLQVRSIRAKISYKGGEFSCWRIEYCDAAGDIFHARLTAEDILADPVLTKFYNADAKEVYDRQPPLSVLEGNDPVQ